MDAHAQIKPDPQAPVVKSLRWLVALPFLFACLLVILVWRSYDQARQREEEQAAKVPRADSRPTWRPKPRPTPEPATLPAVPRPGVKPALAAISAPQNPQPQGPESRSAVAMLVPAPLPPPAQPENKFISSGTGLTPTNWGVIGRASLKGTPPKETEFSVDPACGRLELAPHTTRHYLVSSNHGLADVFIEIKEVPAIKTTTPLEPVLLDQIGCQFVPYVLAVQTGQRLLVRNSDPILHNIHIAPHVAKNVEATIKEYGKRELSVAHAQGSADIQFVFRAEEPFINFRCDVHPWMFAYVCVVDHPWFGVSDLDGNFHLPPLPPGNYVIEATHRKAGTLNRMVKILPGKVSVVNFVFEPKSGATQ